MSPYNINGSDLSVANNKGLPQQEKAIRIMAGFNATDGEVLEASINGSGGLKVDLADEVGNSVFVGAFGEQLTGVKKDDISVSFQYDQLNTQYDLNATATAVTGDGVNTATGSYAQASSATTGTAVIQSRDSIRYRPGHTGFGDFTASFVGAGNGWAGPHDDDDGFALKMVNGVASFGYIKGGVETGSGGAAGFDTFADWNGDNIKNSIDFTNLNIFRVTFGYLGVANATLRVRKNGWHPLHTVKTEGRLTGTHVNNPVFPIRIKAENGMIVKTGSWNGGNIGNGSTVGIRPFHFPNTLVVDGVVTPEQASMELTSTDVGSIAIFRSKATFQGKTNKVKARLLSYEFHIDIPSGNVVGEVVFQIVGVQTLSGAGSFTDINTTSSIMEYDHTAGTGASVDVTAGTPILTKTLQYVGSNKGGVASSASIDAESLGAFAYAGDQFAIVAKDLGDNGVTVRVDLNWEELF